MEKYIGLVALFVAIFTISYQYNKKFLDWLRFQSIGTRDYIHEKLRSMFIDIDPQKILMAQFALSFGLGSIAFLALLPNLLPGAILG